MRAFVLTGPNSCDVMDVPVPTPGPGQAVVDVARAGICGTDVKLSRHARTYPLRPGHEWCGTVHSVGSDVDPSWIGRRVTGETMLGCGRCGHCQDGNPNLCPDRSEIGVRGNWPGAFAEQILVPVSALHPLPGSITDDMGAMIEPAANSCRAFQKAGVGAGARLLVLGPGTIGLSAAGFALAAGCEVHVLGLEPVSLRLARTVGVDGAWTVDDLPDLPWNAVIDATGAPSMAQFAIDRVRPGGSVVLIGGSASSTIAPGQLLSKELVVSGILGGSQAFAATIDAFASGAVDPKPMIAGVVGLENIASVLNGQREDSWAARPKVLVDPRKWR